MAESTRITAYSPDTDTHYDTWDELVEAESNGYVVVVIITEGKQTWPYVVGPLPTKAEAERYRTNLRNKWKREMREEWWRNQTAKFHVRPAWRHDR